MSASEGVKSPDMAPARLCTRTAGQDLYHCEGCKVSLTSSRKDGVCHLRANTPMPEFACRQQRMESIREKRVRPPDAVCRAVAIPHLKHQSSCAVVRNAPLANRWSAHPVAFAIQVPSFVRQHAGAVRKDGPVFRRRLPTFLAPSPRYHSSAVSAQYPRFLQKVP